MPGSGKKSLCWICAAFLLNGILHVLCYQVDFVSGISQTYCCVVLVIWGLSIQKRVTDRRLRCLLLSAAVCLILYLALQAMRYEMVKYFLWLDRHLWYAFYLPLTALPILCFFIALGVHRPQDVPFPRWVWLIPAMGLLLVLGVLTNDRHFFFYSFGEIMIDDAEARREWLYYAIGAFQYILYAVSFLTMFRKSRACRGQKYRWLPLLPLAAGIAYSLLYPMRIGFLLIGHRIWNMGEFLVFCLVGAMECCIQTGLFPANTDYEQLFTRMDLPVAIVDGQDHIKYLSGDGTYPFPENESTRVMRRQISGGSVVWAVHVSRLHALNQTLQETSRKLEARNDYLTEEARIKAEKTEAATRNALYDRITRITKPQINAITELLEQPALSFDDKMRPITVMSTYIKRRSNMELLTRQDLLPLDELDMAVKETVDCLRLCGVSTAASSAVAGEMPAGLVKAAYAQIESVIEACFDTLSGLMISLKSEQDTLNVRMMLMAEALTLPDVSAPLAAQGFTQKLSVAKSGQDVILLFTYTAGGESA